MKKNITISFILIILFCLVSCDTITHFTNRVSVDRNPVLTILNQTGFPVTVTAPVSKNIINGGSIFYQPTVTNQNINVTYTIYRIPFAEQIEWNNEDASVTLTKRPSISTNFNQIIIGTMWDTREAGEYWSITFITDTECIFNDDGFDGKGTYIRMGDTGDTIIMDFGIDGIMIGNISGNKMTVLIEIENYSCVFTKR